MNTRDVLRRVAKKTGLGESKSRTIFNSLIEEGSKVLMDGDEWLLPGLGKIRVELGEEPTPRVVFEPDNRFNGKLETDFCENRELRI